MAAAAGAWSLVLGPTEAATGPITAIPLALLAESTATPAAATGGGTTATTGAMAATAAAQPAAATGTAATTGLTLLQISQAQSQVRFITIPNVPSVANVSQAVQLEINFVAVALPAAW